MVLVVPTPGTPSETSAHEPLIVGDHRTVTLVNLDGQRAEALLDRIAAGIGAAVDAVEAFWGTDWPHQIVVAATGSLRQFAAEAGGGRARDVGQWSDVAAVAVAKRVDPAHRTATGQRVVFAPGAAEMSTTALRIVLSHELFHYAARADTALDAPRWLTEGVADFVARAATPQAERPVLPLTLPSDSDLSTAGPARERAYDRAWWFARYVADRYGTPTLRELYIATCAPGHVDLPTAVRSVLDAELPDVLADWQQWGSR